MPFTPNQQQAISARNHKILISAAAGSGKTTVLIQRVLSLMREGMPLERMLIVTFTRASAADMRQRLLEELEKETDPAIRDQAFTINRANICTLHVFCLRMIREYFHAADIDPMSHVAEQYILDKLYDKAWEQVLESNCAEPDDNMKQLFDSFSFDEIRNMAENCRKMMLSCAEPEKWLSGITGEDRIDAAFAFLRNECLARTRILEEILNKMALLLTKPNAPLKYEKNWNEDRILLDTLKTDLKNNTVREKDSYKMGRSATISSKDEVDPDLKAEYTELRSHFKEEKDKLLSLYPPDPDQARQDILFTFPALRALAALTDQTEILYSHLKRKKNYLEYSDLEHLFLKVLQDENIRKRITDGIDAVFVDECQDISALQDSIIEQLVTEKTLYFMVGDVKQSIYRFRLAEPTLFQRKYEDFSSDSHAEERKIILQDNFRSAENLLACVNHVFTGAMRRQATELDYDEAARLRPGRSSQNDEDTELILLYKNENAAEENDNELTYGFRYEAALIARTIQNLKKNGIHDRDGQKKQVNYRDIAILLRNASGKAPVIARILSSEGIPVYSDADAQFYTLPEVTDLLSLLRVLDNPYRDVPLISALHSPCFQFTNSELASIRLHRKNEPYHTLFFEKSREDSALGMKVRDALQKLDEWRFISRQISVEALIWLILRESGLYEYAGTLENGELRQANMRMLCEQASAAENPYDLHSFLQSVEYARISDDGKSAKSISENEDVVRIMTIHKSKGLEFEIVFLSELSHTFRTDHDPCLFDSVYGAALRYTDPELRIKKETFMMKAFLLKKQREQLAEECRLLYVGMTRAKKKLYLLASPKYSPKELFRWSMPPSDSAASSAVCMLDWICQAVKPDAVQKTDCLYTDPGSGHWRITFINANTLSTNRKNSSVSFEPDDTPVGDMIRYYMDRQSETLKPLKISVSSVSKKLKTEDDMNETPRDKREIPRIITKPDFLEENRDITGAQLGTIVHKALGTVDYDLIRSGCFAEAADMLYARQLLTEQELRLLRPDVLRSFFCSPLGSRALASPLIHREWPFNLQLSAGTILQGVIDLCFIEGDQWILVDYKTDACSLSELAERYSVQLNWYRTALERITHISVKEAFLFSLKHGEAVAVAPSDPSADISLYT